MPSPQVDERAAVAAAELQGRPVNPLHPLKGARQRPLVSAGFIRGGQAGTGVEPVVGRQALRQRSLHGAGGTQQADGQRHPGLRWAP